MKLLGTSPMEGRKGGKEEGTSSSLSLRAAPIDPSPTKAAPSAETPGAAAWALLTSHLPVRSSATRSHPLTFI